MSRVDQLVERYQTHVKYAWERNLAAPQRVWFVVYDKSDERRIRARLEDFEIATKQAGHQWKLCDLTDSFPRWMAAHEYRESYFEDPEAMEIQLKEFGKHVIQELHDALQADGVDTDTVVAVVGIAGLFGYTRASGVIEKADNHIRGRLAVFFPGAHEDKNYRLLDARDGWNYLGVPITAHDETEA